MGYMYRSARKINRKIEKYGVGALRLHGSVTVRNSDFSSSAPYSTVFEAQNHDGNRLQESSWYGLRSFLDKPKSQLLLLLSKKRSKRRMDMRRKAVLKRAFAYSQAYFLTYLFPIISTIRFLRGHAPGPTLNILSRLFFPLQGFFNFVVFTYPKIFNRRPYSIS